MYVYLDRILNGMRLLGKSVCICSIVIAVLSAIVYQQFWSPFAFYVSVACWIGLFFWTTGALGRSILQRRGVTRGVRS